MRSMRVGFLYAMISLCFTAQYSIAQESAPDSRAAAEQERDNSRRASRRGFGPIELGPDDVAVYESPPEGFNEVREG